jgi:DNA-binding response OmpR family regulator
MNVPPVPPSVSHSASPPGGDVVLVVDDEEDIRRLVTFNLGDAGFRVESVENGADALVAAARLRPSVVVLDLMLPDVSGMEVCRRLRADESVADAAILMLTARDEGKRLAWRGLEIDPTRHRVVIDGAELTLRPLEYKLLAIFVEHPGRVFSRTDLLQEVWGILPETNTRTVDTHIRRLRERLGAYSEAIETVHGFGYRLRDPEAT